MSFSIKDNEIFQRNHVMQGNGFAMAIRVTDGQSLNEKGKTFYSIKVDDPISGEIYFDSFAQLQEFSQLLSDFCANEQNVLIGRDYERFLNEQIRKNYLYKKREKQRKARKKKRQRKENQGDQDDKTPE